MSTAQTDLRFLHVVTTTGVANNSATTTILAAPGAGLRYRVWGCSVTFTDTAQAPTKWRGLFLDGNSNPIAYLSGSDFGGDWCMIPGGVALDPNTTARCSRQSAVGAMDMALGVWYTIERTSG